MGTRSWPHLLADADRMSAAEHQWRDFTPLPLVFYTGSRGESLMTVRMPVSGVAEAITAAGKVAARRPAGLAGIGVACSAWASRQAVANLLDPKTAEDRQRSRITYAIDTDTFEIHVHMNISGQVSVESYAPGDRSPGSVASHLATTLSEALFGQAALICSTGRHTRPATLSVKQDDIK